MIENRVIYKLWKKIVFFKIFFLYVRDNLCLIKLWNEKDRGIELVKFDILNGIYVEGG